MVGRNVIQHPAVPTGSPVGLRVRSADAPVGVGDVAGPRNIAKVLAGGLELEAAGPVAEVGAEGPATRVVVASSLTVSGKLSKVSKSGSLGEPLAAHSAWTARRTESRIRCRVASV